MTRLSLAVSVAVFALVAPLSAASALTISFQVAKLVQLSALRDVVFTDPSAVTGATNAQDVCLWSNLDSRGYTIRATGDGGAFELAESMGTKKVSYDVAWATAGGATSGTSLSSGNASSIFTSRALTPNCSAGSAAMSTLLITIPPSSVQRMTGDRTYTGTLTLVVAPT